MNPENIIESITNGDGYVVLPKFWYGNFLSDLQEEFDIILNNYPNDGRYKFGKACRKHLSLINKESAIYEAFNNLWHHQVTNQYFNIENHFLNRMQNHEIFFTHEYRNDQGLETNGYLHFDQIHTLKFFIYLTDCDKSSGALHLVPNTRKLGKAIREDYLKKFGNYQYIKNKIIVDHPELKYSMKDAIPIEEEAGTLIVFDTDTFHCGGIIEKEKQRKIIRLHVRR